jgi:hypothetical protein
VGRGCGAPTQPRNGKGEAYGHFKRCHPGAIAPKWTRERVREAMRAWRDRYGEPPSSYDWSGTHVRRRGGQALAALAEKLAALELATGAGAAGPEDRDWPSRATVADLHETWAAARADAFESGPSPPWSRRVLRSAERRRQVPRRHATAA